MQLLEGRETIVGPEVIDENFGTRATAPLGNKVCLVEGPG